MQDEADVGHALFGDMSHKTIAGEIMGYCVESHEDSEESEGEEIVGEPR